MVSLLSSNHRRRLFLISWQALALLGLSSASPNLTFASEAELAVHNRTGYPMIFALWGDGRNCKKKVTLNPDFNINAKEPQTIMAPADKLIAAGVAVYEMQDRLPMACDYILSFKLAAGVHYTLTYDVRDRRCFGQLYESAANGVYQLILPGEKLELSERISAFGWDYFEPGCEEQ